MELPDDVPLLVTADVSTRFGDYGDRKCLRTWFEVTFDSLPVWMQEKIFRSIMEEARQETGYYGLVPPDVGAGDLAAIWNRGMRALGYGVDDYLCATLKSGAGRKPVTRPPPIEKPLIKEKIPEKKPEVKPKSAPTSVDDISDLFRV